AAIEFEKIKTTIDELCDGLKDSNVRDFQRAALLRSLLVDLKNTESALITAKTEEETNNVIKKAGEIENRIELLTTSIGGNLTGQSRALFDRYQMQYSTFYGLHLQVRDLAGRNSNSKAEELSEGEVDRLDQAVDAVLNELEAQIEGKLAADATFADEMYASTIQSMMVVIVIAVIIGVLVALWLLRDITTSLDVAKETIRKVAKGD